jgi:hypothetical protein
MMTTKTRKIVSGAVAIAIFGLFSLSQPALAQSKCRQARGVWVDGLPGTPYTGQSGTITQGGILNGTTVVVYDPAFVITPNPNVVAYIAELTIATRHGQLKTSNVYLYDNAKMNLWTAMGFIDAKTSTGRFAGATGVLYFNGKTIGTYPLAVYPSNITGQICFTREIDDEEDRDYE